MEQVTITRHGGNEAGEYHARVAGSEAIGKLTWVLHGHGHARVADHTIVPPEIGGRGVAARLVEALVSDPRAEGFLIVPECSYVAAAFTRHPEWGDLLGTS